jgi:hypothetical protein
MRDNLPDKAGVVEGLFQLLPPCSPLGRFAIATGASACSWPDWYCFCSARRSVGSYALSGCDVAGGQSSPWSGP